MRAALAVRGRVAEEELCQAVTRGVRQFVVLGAGVDTFAYRNTYEPVGLQVYEVDHPATQRWKTSLLRAADISIPQSVIYVGVDFEYDNIADKLRHAGFREDLPACFSWLGVTVYLTQQAVFNTLTWIASLPHDSSVTFDYVADSAVLNPIDKHVSGLLAAAMAERGEPWLSYFSPTALEKQLRDLGFSTATSLAPDDLNERLLQRRKDGLRVGGGFRMMCAKV